MEYTIEVKAKTGNYNELWQTIQAILPAIRKEIGCQDCRIYQDVENSDILFITVQWKARANLYNFMRSTNGSALIGAIELLSEKTRVRNSRGAPWEGIEALKRIKK